MKEPVLSFEENNNTTLVNLLSTAKTLLRLTR